MKNRLFVAKSLLRKDGFIFINIDDNQQPYLSVLMDEVFGCDNKFDKVSIKTSSSQGGFGDVNPGYISNSSFALGIKCLQRIIKNKKIPELSMNLPQ